MSRTYRSNPSVKFEYETSDGITVIHGPWVIEYPRFRSLSKGGWKEAKRLLSKEAYAEQRKLRGDKLTGYMRNASVPRWFRRMIERQYRQRTALQIHTYHTGLEYDLMIAAKPESVEWYYQY